MFNQKANDIYNEYISRGADNGLRVSLLWDDGNEVVVHSWAAVSALIKKDPAPSDQHIYHSRHLIGRRMARRPDEGHSFDECTITILRPGRRGAPANPAKKEEEKLKIQARIDKRDLEIQKLNISQETDRRKLCLLNQN